MKVIFCIIRGAAAVMMNQRRIPMICISSIGICASCQCSGHCEQKNCTYRYEDIDISPVCHECMLCLDSYINLSLFIRFAVSRNYDLKKECSGRDLGFGNFPGHSNVLLHQPLGLAYQVSLFVQYLYRCAHKVALVYYRPLLANGIHTRLGGQRLEIRTARALCHI